MRGTLTEDGLCVAEGFHLLEEALRSECEIPIVLAAASVKTAVEGHVRGLSRVRVNSVPDDLFRKISATETTQGVIALVRAPSWSLDQIFRGQSLVVVLDGVQDPGNAGAIIRSAEAFGATGIVFLKGSANPYNPKSLRASAGSIFRVPIVTGIDDGLLLAASEQRKLEMYALAPAGVLEIVKCHFERRCVLIVGSEGHGVSSRLRAKSIDVRIPAVTVESLNAALAAGIALYEARRQRMAVM